MDIEKAFAISASALDAQRARLNVISSNLANVESTQTAEGGPYRRKDVVFATAPIGSFEETLQMNLEGSQPGVSVTRVIQDDRPFKRVYEPQHPEADPDGYVLYPNINAMEEMVNMISALRSYEANVTALNATKSMALKALDIGR
ncbi:MAG: flagellar basal body rod protein FlgC [Candidatus Manganitrophaceae bacterium]|nr:MAG: flagellar basal body rod protein FlgC [Candidatus Manganitrophaceae bacterium]